MGKLRLTHCRLAHTSEEQEQEHLASKLKKPLSPTEQPASQMYISTGWHFGFWSHPPKSPATARAMPLRVHCHIQKVAWTPLTLPHGTYTLHHGLPPQRWDISWCYLHLFKLTWKCPSHTSSATSSMSSNPDQCLVGKLLSAKINFCGLQLST